MWVQKPVASDNLKVLLLNRVLKIGVYMFTLYRTHKDIW